jgi:hypothetical protein
MNSISIVTKITSQNKCRLTLHVSTQWGHHQIQKQYKLTKHLQCGVKNIHVHSCVKLILPKFYQILVISRAVLSFYIWVNMNILTPHYICLVNFYCFCAWWWSYWVETCSVSLHLFCGEWWLEENSCYYMFTTTGCLHTIFNRPTFLNLGYLTMLYELQ